ncbi:MAG: hypothetical protein OHK93_001703 [Ramalina farinacea]|uniref:Inosine/uridine-preferring nucleoside hydrolase domain-containing protein n=1 Tax=Ramalina farinacea TaxID=258253 RepID=A0AA43TWI8_9LECA|nr:hypothetical protein [Ramalina farinacea]
MAKNKIIIDTDPGCDDVLALLLALASSPDDVEILLISVTYGNVSLKGCLQNVISTFHVIEKERQWRKSQGLPEGFEMLSKHKPMIAVGAEGPLGGQKKQADYYPPPFHPLRHLLPPLPPPTTTTTPSPPPPPPPPTNPPPNSTHLFTPSPLPAIPQILALLSLHPPDTLTLLALGPLTNFALAAARAPTTFLRARAVCIMGGALSLPGNITPVGEFNTLADPVAAARVYALTSPNPATTMPPSASGGLPPYSPPSSWASGG